MKSRIPGLDGVREIASTPVDRTAEVGLAAFRWLFAGLVAWDLAELATHPELWAYPTWILLVPLATVVAVAAGHHKYALAVVAWTIAAAALVPGFHTQDTILIMGSWLLLLLPVERPVPINAVPLTGFVVGLIYLDSGIRKALSPMWQSGLGVWAPASIPHAIHGRIPLLDNEPVMLALGYGVILFEVLWLPAYALFRRLRRPLAVAGILFHLAISFYYPFHIFSAGMIALLLPSAIHDWKPTRGPVSPTLAKVGVVWAALSMVVLAGVIPMFRPVSTATQTFMLPITGLYSRGVFDDSLFANHGFQWGTDHWSEDGFLSRGTVNRTWETWWKTVHIRGPQPGEPFRALEVSLTDHQPGLLDRNLAAEWSDG